MNELTVEDVRAIIDTDLLDDAIVAYMDSTIVMVTELFAEKNISDALRKEITRWLTAHAIAITKERMATEEEAGGARVKYASNFSGRSLNSSPYGQQAMIIDTTDTLNDAVKMKKVVFFAIKENWNEYN